MPLAVTHVVIENILYDVHELTPDTLGQLVRYDLHQAKTVEEILKNKTYKSIKKVGPIPKK